MSAQQTKNLIPATEADTEHLRYFLRAMPFAGSTFAPHCRAVAAEPLPPVNARGGRDCEGWTCIYEADVQNDWLNGGQGLHGAAAAWLLDMFTGTSLHRLGNGDWSPWGPSINFEINFYNPAPAGSTIRVETIVDRAGGAVSTVLCLMSDKKTGRRILTGIHTVQRPKGGPFGAATGKFAAHSIKLAEEAAAKEKERVKKEAEQAKAKL